VNAESFQIRRRSNDLVVLKSSGSPLLSADGRRKVKKTALVVLGLFLCGMLAMAAPKDSSWDGWISDSKCGVKGANAAHAACAKKCIDGGEKAVLVTDKDQKVVAIENSAAVAGHEGQHVKVTGSMGTDGSLHVDKVTVLAQGEGKGSGMNDMH
jgi:hypothetical protein